jgi:hypothetical protein
MAHVALVGIDIGKHRTVRINFVNHNEISGKTSLNSVYQDIREPPTSRKNVYTAYPPP